MDVVYICRPGDNEELRYSLRSIADNLAYNNVWLVGGKPDWYRGYHIAVKQTGTKYANGRKNLRAVVDADLISNEFVLMNDDFYVMKPTEVVPYFHGGDIMDKIRVFEGFAANSKYLQMLWDTVHILARNGSPTTLDYALHTPMRMRRDKLGPLLEYEASIRTLYGNLNRVGGEYLDDVKIHTRPRSGVPQPDYLESEHQFLSTHDRTFTKVYKELLKHVFNEPSPFE